MSQIIELRGESRCVEDNLRRALQQRGVGVTVVFASREKAGGSEEHTGAEKYLFHVLFVLKISNRCSV